jgi:putative ABC transport system permease protein
MGVRAALGARPEDLVRLVVGEGMRLAGIGVVVGLIGAAALTRLLSRLLFDVAPTDPATYAAGVGLLSLVALLATYLPARSLTRLDPLRALRHE